MKRRVIQVVIVAAVAVVAIAGFLVFPVFSGDAPPEAALSSASVDPAATGTSSDLAATWSLDTTGGSLDDGSSTFAGYRVEEQLSTIGSHEAVGRTQEVSGSMTPSSSQVTTLVLSIADTGTIEFHLLFERG